MIYVVYDLVYYSHPFWHPPLHPISWLSILFCMFINRLRYSSINIHLHPRILIRFVHPSPLQNICFFVSVQAFAFPIVVQIFMFADTIEFHDLNFHLICFIFMYDYLHDCWRRIDKLQCCTWMTVISNIHHPINPEPFSIRLLGHWTLVSELYKIDLDMHLFIPPIARRPYGQAPKFR